MWPVYIQYANDGLAKELIVNLNSASFSAGNTTVNFSPSSITQAIPAGDSNSSKRIARFDFTAPTSNFNGTLSVSMGDIRLLAQPGNSTSIRDWIEGSVINKLLPINTTISYTNTVNWTVGQSVTIPTSYDPEGNVTSNTTVTAWNTTSNLTSIQRKDVRISRDSSGNYSFANNSSTSPWGVNPHTLCSASSAYDSIINYRSYSGAATAIPDDNSANSLGRLAFQLGDVQARGSANYFVRSGYLASDWPSDILSQDEVCINFRFFNVNRYFPPKLLATDFTGNGLYIWPGDLGKVMTDRMYRTLRMFWQPTQERARGFIPDWALLDLVSFSSNQSAKFPLKIAPMNPNGSFNCLAAPTPRPRNNIQCLTKPFDSNLFLASSIALTTNPRSYSTINMNNSGWLTVGANTSISMTSNITQNISNNSSIAWTRNGTNTWNAYRTIKNWPSSRLILPSEVAEIKSISDNVYWSSNPNDPNIGPTTEANENRLAAFFPGLTLCSNFFTIYAYAQALDKTGTNIESEALTKTLVEVEIVTAATATDPATYRVKKLYTQPIPMGQ